MESRPSYTLVGLFVLLLAAGAVFFALWMGKFSERKKIYRDYYTYMFESVSGLPKNGAVKFMGVEIGKVSDIHINSNDPTRIRLTLRLPADFVVREGMYTQLKLEGVTGIAYVDISGGRAGAKPIEMEKGRIPIIPSKPSALTKLGDALPKVAVNMADAFERINKILSEDTIEHLNGIVANLDASTRRLKSLISERNTRNIRRLLQNLADASERLEKLYEASDAVKAAALKLTDDGNRTMRAIQESAEAFRRMSDTFTRHLDEGQFDFQSMLNPTITRADALLETTQSLLYELEEEIGQLRQSPRDLLFKESRPLLGPGERSNR
ncbi:MlaD family protein [Hydrogenimonas urashimensis]|uniref:MlaD family protein n=1 Tax=Hydrogenimonas urashimensis TaxID=2740515 RepID=UPI001916853C|nr:MlaD family protein [Hydrogenimonas urashimensis]